MYVYYTYVYSIYEDRLQQAMKILYNKEFVTNADQFIVYCV